MNSNYYDIDQIQTLKFPEKNKSLSLFHINACSLSKNFDDLEHLLKCTNKAFDIVAVSETRITKKTSLTSNINLQNYSFELPPIETNAGGTLLYIANHLSYKPGTDLNLNIANQVEFIFVEIINSRKSNIIVGCLYKHPSILDSLASNSFIPYILEPTRIISHSKTHIDNIFSNIISHGMISSNITATISDHLPQFLFPPNVLLKGSC